MPAKKTGLLSPCTAQMAQHPTLQLDASFVYCISEEFDTVWVEHILKVQA